MSQGLRIRRKERLAPDQALEKTALYDMVKESIDAAWRDCNQSMHICDIDDAQVLCEKLVITVYGAHIWDSNSLNCQLAKRNIGLPQISADTGVTRRSPLVLRFPMRTFGNYDDTTKEEEGGDCCGCILFILVAVFIFFGIMMLAGNVKNDVPTNDMPQDVDSTTATWQEGTPQNTSPEGPYPVRPPLVET